MTTKNIIITVCIAGLAVTFHEFRFHKEQIFKSKEETQIFIVTAYCPCELCCGRWSDGHFANGEKVRELAIAAPKEIPFGTLIDVPGYGIAEVKDRGGAIKGNKIDVYFDEHEVAKKWGVQELKCKIIKDE